MAPIESQFYKPTSFKATCMHLRGHRIVDSYEKAVKQGKEEQRVRKAYK